MATFHGVNPGNASNPDVWTEHAVPGPTDTWELNVGINIDSALPSGSSGGPVVAPAYGGPSTFGYSGTGSIGSATLPPPTNVLSGQVFGLSGSGSTGTYLPRRRP